MRSVDCCDRDVERCSLGEGGQFARSDRDRVEDLRVEMDSDWDGESVVFSYELNNLSIVSIAVRVS
jgi:hypothetical protein